MTGLDTHMVVRYLAKDDPAQSILAVCLMRSFSLEEPGFLSLLVLAELCWALETCYRFSKTELVDVLEPYSAARNSFWNAPTWSRRQRAVSRPGAQILLIT
jgi:predicted nucleic-acid-binding protein